MAIAIAAVAVGGSLMDSYTDKKNAENEEDWAKYNAHMTLMSDTMNLTTQAMITKTNVQLNLAAAKVNAEATLDSAVYNARMVAETTAYNDQLYEDALTNAWNDAGLDLHNLDKQRAHEMGKIKVGQGASGTVSGIGSNADVQVSSMTQGAMDTFVVKHNATEKMRTISNARAQSIWEGDNAVKKIMWEGETNAATAMMNAKLQGLGASTTSGLQTTAGTLTSQSQYYSTIGSAAIAKSSRDASNMSGLFGSIIGGG